MRFAENPIMKINQPLIPMLPVVAIRSWGST